jgi:ABC-2 type transport system ATP-binding protein
MDEAERCHRIAYIAYGQLLTSGTVPAVVAKSGLVTWSAEGPEGNGIGDAARALRGAPGVEMVASFGTALHVSGTDPDALEAATAPWRERGGLVWRRIEPTLEDVFIHLMGSSKDNFA